MSRRPEDQVKAGRAHYRRTMPAVETAHFGVLWHLFTLGHLVTTDLDAVARELGCSFADLDLLGTLAVDQDGAMRATDLASALYISDAVVSTRVRRLVAQGLIERTERPGDRRAFILRLTESGRRLIARAIPTVSRDARIVHFFEQLAPVDRDTLVRILGDLHRRYDREFVGTPYTTV